MADVGRGPGGVSPGSDELPFAPKEIGRWGGWREEKRSGEENPVRKVVAGAGVRAIAGFLPSAWPPP